MIFFQTEMSYKKNPKALTQFQFCEAMQIPLALVIGESEIANGTVKLRNIATREEVRRKKMEGIRMLILSISWSFNFACYAFLVFFTVLFLSSSQRFSWLLHCAFLVFNPFSSILSSSDGNCAYDLVALFSHFNDSWNYLISFLMPCQKENDNWQQS